jgi:hypothetical protein
MAPQIAHTHTHRAGAASRSWSGCSGLQRERERQREREPKRERVTVCVRETQREREGGREGVRERGWGGSERESVCERDGDPLVHAVSPALVLGSGRNCRILNHSSLDMADQVNIRERSTRSVMALTVSGGEPCQGHRPHD